MVSYMMIRHGGNDKLYENMELVTIYMSIRHEDNDKLYDNKTWEQ